MNSEGLFRYGKKTNESLTKNLKNQNINAIINCAVSYNETKPEEMYATNVLLPQSWLQQAVDYDIKFVSFGSFFEKHTGKYKAKYVQTKKEFKSIILSYRFEKAYYLTLEHIYGKYDHKEKFIPSVVDTIKQHNQIILNDPNTIRDFTPVSLVKNSVDFVVSGTNAPLFFDVGTSFQSSTIDFVARLVRYKKPAFDAYNFIKYGKEVRNEFDVIRSSSAKNIPKILRISAERAYDLEQMAFKELFEC